MALYRPHVPLSVRVAVATGQLAQCGKFRLAVVADGGTDTLGRRLEILLVHLAGELGCPRDQLRLDHDPPLAARPQERRGLGKKTYYTPDANDPEHLFYRPHGAEFSGSHLIKTNTRGDHGQHPDRVLIKKMKNLERGPRPKRQPGFKSKAPKRPWPSRPFDKRRKMK